MFFKDKETILDKDNKWVHHLKMVRALRGDVEWEWDLCQTWVLEMVI